MDDYVDSDDMELVLEMSRAEHAQSLSSGSTTELQTTSSSPARSKPPPLSHLCNELEQELKEELATVRVEIGELDVELDKLRELRARRAEAERVLVNQLNGLQQERRRIAIGCSSNSGSVTGQPKDSGIVDYADDDWEWTDLMRSKMKQVFGIDGFRLCQKSVCNANMDGADIVCVMPTGGGKSLTYQLPALLTPGVTLVISPLISLITDQILHLREAGVDAVMLTGSTSKEESRNIFSRLAAQAARRPDAKEIKLLYVTPERIARSKTFMSMVTKLANAGRLARIVIDEAHCVSQLGHDFRPDYRKLNVLRQLFPNVPIMALSATCPPKVLKDLVTTLRLPPVVDGTSAKTKHTLYFSAPLYRKNLHYTVLPKPSSFDATIQVMAGYILERHSGESGIVYCLSKNDAARVAGGLQSTSEGKIRTGVYHADVKDQEKQDLHRLWRKGDIKVVCATIAFGLGIDKSDVRFVLHHALSKSLDGFYQESGRAGRDGRDADCVLYYRPQDAVRLSALVCGEVEGQQKLHGMLSFAAEMEQCRKVHFAKYFSTSSHLSIASWSTDEKDALARCGHCDNCTRTPETLERKDVTLEAWQILKVAEAVQRDKGQLTLGMLADLVRGVGAGTFDIRGNSKCPKEKGKEKAAVDLEAVANGRVALSKDNTEGLIIQLILSGYLVEEFNQTAYNTNVYFTIGPNALRFTRHSKENLNRMPEMVFSFRKPVRKAVKRTRRNQVAGTSKKEKPATSNSRHDKVDEHCILLDSDNDVTGPTNDFSEGRNDGDDDDGDGDWQNITQLHPPKRVYMGASTSTTTQIGNREVDIVEVWSD